MSIFAKPTPSNKEEDYSLKVLFLHGLEGSSSGAKSTYLKSKWGAVTPIIRTADLRALKEESQGSRWEDIKASDIERATKQSYSDAAAAVTYLKPDIVIGSSMGGALLAKLIVEEKYVGPAVFLAPAIAELCPGIKLPEKHDAVWLIGELDETVSNFDCVNSCVKTGGSLMVSQQDGHRLQKALEKGLIDVAIVTALQLNQTTIL